MWVAGRAPLSSFQEETNGEEFDAFLRGEDGVCRGAGSSCCRRDHDELECCFSPDYRRGIWPGESVFPPSTLPFHAPPFDKIKDDDYQPAIEAGVAQNLEEIKAIADNPAEPHLRTLLWRWRRAGC